MLKIIPWDTVGPVLTGLIIILVLVFGFILKFQKASRMVTYPPKDINSTSKKTLCFSHEGRIEANKEAVRIFGGALREANRVNGEQHGKLFDKLEEQKIQIIQEIQKVNGSV